MTPAVIFILIIGYSYTLIQYEKMMIALIFDLNAREWSHSVGQWTQGQPLIELYKRVCITISMECVTFSMSQVLAFYS